MKNLQERFLLSNKVALITGGAMGIGVAVARGFSDLGATVIISDRNIEQGEKFAAELAASGAKASFIPLDVTSESEWKGAIDAVAKDFKRLDVLVNNAGILFAKTADDTSLEEFRTMQNVNIDGVFLGSKYAARLMKKTATAECRASIINISSVGGLLGMKMLSAYCMSKGAVRLLTKSMAAELGVDHIRINSVHPSVIETNMGAQVTDMVAETMGLDSETASAALASLNALQCNGQPEDVAAAVAFLASEASNFMTGSEVVVDGGTSSSR